MIILAFIFVLSFNYSFLIWKFVSDVFNTLTAPLALLNKFELHQELRNLSAEHSVIIAERGNG